MGQTGFEPVTCLESPCSVATFIYFIPINILMKLEMVQIPKKEYEELLEEVGILRNPEMMEAIRESDEAKKKGVKPWKLKTHP